MGKITVLVELRQTPALTAMALEAARPTAADLEATGVPKIPGVKVDTTFAPVQLPGTTPRSQSGPYDTAALFELRLEPEESTYLVRAEVDEKKVNDVRANPAVLGVFSDPVIEPAITCGGSPAVGTDADVERLLCVPALKRAGMDGFGVLVAVVDTGINMAYLNSRGKNPTFDAARSWVPQAGLVPGSLPVSHGTMCAFDVCIAAPRCTLLDIAVLLSPAGGTMSGLLSDAVRAYRHLIDIMVAVRRAGETRSMVVNNSWGMFRPSQDFPPGDPGNYSDNPNHPFNRIVGDLEQAGADILFAAGNCGPDCPDVRCQGITANAIYGANGHPAVLCIAGVDTTKTRVGYSSIGPGRLTRQKPDLCGYTHFQGSGVYPADGGTSAATPVVSGVVAALRSKRPYDPATPANHPAAIRNVITSGAVDLGSAGYDFYHGHGVVNACALVKPPGPIDICRRYPWLCRSLPPDLCHRFPWLCRGPIPLPPIRPPGPIPPGPGPRVPIPPPSAEPVEGWEGVPAGADAFRDSAALGEGEGGEGESPDLIELSYLIGYVHGQERGGAPGGSKASKGCG